VTVFTQPANNSKKNKITAATILKSLEPVLGCARNEWNGSLLRALWPALEERLDATFGGSRGGLAHYGRVLVAPRIRRCPG
jgi:hypothetical protein